MKTKADIRACYRRLRLNLTPAFCVEAAQSALNIIKCHPPFQKSQHIGCYMPFRGEFDTSLIIEEIWLRDKSCYLPTLNEEKSLDFVRYCKDDKLIPNQFNILEPENTAVKIKPENLDLIIVPLVAYDLEGKRLGAGGGYYDRTFAFLHSNPIRKPYLLGLAFSCQCMDILPADPWDVHLDAIVTEKMITTFENGGSNH